MLVSGQCKKKVYPSYLLVDSVWCWIPNSVRVMPVLDSAHQERANLLVVHFAKITFFLV